MAIDTLLDALAREAAETARVTRERAAGEAARITADAAARREDRRRAAVAARMIELRAGTAAARSTGLGASRGGEMAARAALVERVMERAREMLGQAAGDPCVGGAAMRRVTAALDHWTSAAPVVVRCSPALEERVRALVASREGASVVADATVAAGAIVAGADGVAEVDGTLEGLLASREQALAIEIVRMAGEPEEVAP